MTTYTVVRFRPKPGMQQEFVETYTSLKRDFDGLRKMALVKVSEEVYFAVAEWEKTEHLVAARPLMAGNLQQFRHTLDFMADESNVTDAFSGEAVYELPGESPAK